MLTAVIRADGSAKALAATFSVLIPAVAQGVLGHAVVILADADVESEELADVTGATCLRAEAADDWRLAAGVTRGDWLLLLDAGDVLAPDWIQSVEHHLILEPDRPALLPLAGVGASLRERAALVLAPRRLRAGLLMPTEQAKTGRLSTMPRRLIVGRQRAAA